MNESLLLFYLSTRNQPVLVGGWSPPDDLSFRPRLYPLEIGLRKNKTLELEGGGLR